MFEEARNSIFILESGTNNHFMLLKWARRIVFLVDTREFVIMCTEGFKGHSALADSLPSQPLITRIPLPRQQSLPATADMKRCDKPRHVRVTSL